MNQEKFTHSIYYLYLFVFCFSACATHDSDKNAVMDTRFTLLPATQTGIDFANTLTEGLNTNILMYEYFYNGGGVAVADLNGDGLDDIYFTGNMVANKLYLNKGDLKFEDITEVSGAGGRETPWKTGVTIADINGDSLLDIYVCYSGNVSPDGLRNQLFINKGNNAAGVPQFEEKAQAYGLAELSNTTQAAFFDYDLDGDLDMFLLNHNAHALPILDEASTAALLSKQDAISGVRLFRQDVKNGEPYFVDVTAEAGIHSSPLTYGLGIGIADINQDGWPDLYICNDYSVPDFLYINTKNGKFTDATDRAIGHTSHSSMGNDIADFNNDGRPDIYTLDMLPEDNRRQKLLTGLDNYELFDFNLKMGYRHQYMRNMLQLNQGIPNKDTPVFSEIGQLAGVSNTDWSWAALFADLDNDGWKDLFVTNGNLRDFTNLDFVKYMGDHLKRIEGKVKREDVLELVYKMPSSNMRNYMYRNNGDLTFVDVAENWGLKEISNSGGAAYADLDNDGDLDLIVNNINLPAFIYRNDTDQKEDNNYLSVKLLGAGKNTSGIGAKVSLFENGRQQFLEQMPTRGYQSSVSHVLHFGLGNVNNIDSLVVIWQSGKSEVIQGPGVNQKLLLEEKNAVRQFNYSESNDRLYFVEEKFPVVINDAVMRINDFKRQPLLVNPLSYSGPALVKGDLNSDGIEDIFVGAKAGEPAQILLGMKNGSFIKYNSPALEADKASQDTDAVFIDVNGDGYTDLFVASGGYGNFTPKDPLLQSRLYMNDGRGNLNRVTDALPEMLTSVSCVSSADLNGDGYPDFFVGGRVIPGRYPEAPRSYILINNGKGQFTDQTGNVAPELERIGMVTDAVFADLNSDGQPELVIAGEWMPVTIFAIQNGRLNNTTGSYFSKPMYGWWNKILAEDLTGDGKPDLIVGNMGLNTQARASDSEPAELRYKDFDDNSSVDPILSFYIQGKSYPYITRDEMLDQMSSMRTRFSNYDQYADAELKDIFTEAELEGAINLTANTLATTFFEMGQDNRFQEKVLPLPVQFSPVFTINALDFDQDGHKDLLLCGNISKARLKFGKYDANYGILLKNDGKGNFSYVPQSQSGFALTGDIRSVLSVGERLLFGINQKALRSFKLNK